MFEAARVHRDDHGKEIAEFPQSFVSLGDAQEYVSGTSASEDGNRPWIRDTTKPSIESFLMIGGHEVEDQSTGMLKERLYKTARIRMDIGFDHIQGMLPGEIVAVKYWKHDYDVTTGIYRPIYFIAKTSEFDHHLDEGTFSTVFNSALEDFCL